MIRDFIGLDRERSTPGRSVESYFVASVGTPGVVDQEVMRNLEEPRGKGTPSVVALPHTMNAEEELLVEIQSAILAASALREVGEGARLIALKKCVEGCTVTRNVTRHEEFVGVSLRRGWRLS